MVRRASTEAGHRRSRLRRVTTIAITASLALALSGCYRVALFGDVPYTSADAGAYERMIGDINRDAPDFSVHVGDIQSGADECTDAIVDRTITWFDRFAQPLMYTPGDNEWTDCAEPRDRLDHLRQSIFRGTGQYSRGARIRSVLPQAGYPENAAWLNGPVTFATIHVVGSGDGSADQEEWSARRAADIAWLRQVFASARARGDRGVVVLTHADPKVKAPDGQKDVYESLFQALRTETMSFFGQVLLVHGNGHQLISDRPMRSPSGSPVTNFQRVEVPGGPGAVRWLRLVVDPQAPELYTVTLAPPS